MSDVVIAEQSADISYHKRITIDDVVKQNIANKNINDEIIDIDKQIAYDRLLTYRRRMARLSAVQALYLYCMKNMINNLYQKDDLFHTEENNKQTLLTDGALSLCQDIIYFYKNVFFTPQEYGNDKKHRKIDEVFMYEIVRTAISNISIIDTFIASKLNQNWTIDKLDTTLLSIIRCAVAEIMLGNYVDKAVLSSEYTNIASDFFSGKPIGFINSITDKLYDVVIAKYPFSKNK
ncbi:MAG: hypothetical protein IJT15_04730 [Rickettsiales bacterium]|nr:hypothetical protein [Rickettsiales bacterium]